MKYKFIKRKCLPVITCAIIFSPAYIVQPLSCQLPLILKSGCDSLVLDAKKTSNVVLNWSKDDFFTLKSKSLELLLSPLKTYHLLCTVNI